ncbi:MAG: TonB family protein, partial [candidate division KSB1 bacterium]|nr:TonB family protein [candidate division KSB1 bacterium]
SRLNQFEVELVPREGSEQNEGTSDVVISGSYKIEGNFISLDYVINLKKTRMKLMHKIDNAELPEIKKAVQRDLSAVIIDFQIHSDPPGASVVVDGKNLGETPITVKEELIGTHSVELRKEGYYGLLQDVEVTRPETLRFSLQPEILKSFMVDEPAQPVGGMAELQRRVVYPEFAKKFGVEGTVVINVTVDADGSVVDTEVLKSLGNNGTTEAAIKAIKEVKWIPGKINNQPVKSTTNVLIRFKLPK